MNIAMHLLRISIMLFQGKNKKTKIYKIDSRGFPAVYFVYNGNIRRI